MAVVYLAREIATGQIVAVKVLANAQRLGPSAARRFAREAETVAALEHPNILRVLRVEELDGAPAAIVSVYVPGETLRAELQRSGPLPFERAAQLMREIASALAYAHERRIVHRDVKPENIVLEQHTGRALLADFGIARPLDAETLLTAVGSSVGTPTYMAPEQVAGLAVDERADVYPIGLVGWEMLAGRRPWEGETLYHVLHKQQHERLPALDELRPDIPTYLLRAIEGAIEKDPACRWRDAAELVARLTPKAAALPPLPAAQAHEPAEVATDPVLAVPPPAEPVAAEAPRPAAAERVAHPAFAAPPLNLPPRGAPGRRRWPVAAALAVLLLAVALYAMSGRAGSRPISGDRSLDSALIAANEAGDVVVVDSGERPAAERPAAERPAAKRPAAPPSGDRCRSAASDDQRACLMVAIDRNDAPLNRAYQALLADVRRRGGDARAVEALRVEQRAWLAERDRACRAAAPESSNELWGVARAPCFADRSARRAAELRARIRS